MKLKLPDVKLWPEKWRLRSRSSSEPWMSLADRRRGTTDSGVRSSEPSQPYLGEAPTMQERRRKTRPTLVEGGRHTGESRVVYRGHNIPLHLLTKDFFISVVQLGTLYIMAVVATLYLIAFFVWSIIWYLIVRFYPGCLYGASTYVESLAFAVVTQMTIGYGNTGPQACWVATWLIILQSIIAVIMEAVVLGVVFARISHPHQRSRSIFMSNKAVVARRDGILKFMFRVADIRTTQVVEPKVKAYLYTWGAGRITAEGERIPVRVEPLDVDYIDGMLLLPLIIEHTIDERSPLCGHTHSSLVALNAELVVTFEGTTEMGNPFMARRSYIPDEIYWGHQFVNVVVPGIEDDDRYSVNLDSFHAVERQSGMPNLHPSQLSQLVVTRAKRTVPYPLLGENTLVLSDVLCVAPDEDGQLTLYCRVGDTYPNQMLEITAKIFLYRWRRDPVSGDARNGPAPGGEAFEQIPLECGYLTGTDRLHLRLPVLLAHPIDADSPLAGWREPGGIEDDIASEIVVVINAYMNVNNNNILRQRTYNVSHHVRMGWGFVPIVKHPALARDGKPRVRWQAFHDTQRVPGMEEMLWPAPRGSVSAGNTCVADGSMSAAPESHANMRAFKLNSLPAAFTGQYHNLNLERNDFTVLPMDLQRYAAAVGGDASQVTGSPKASDEGPFVLFPEIGHMFDNDMTDASTSLPYAAALHPALPGPDRFRMDSDAMEMPPAVELSRYNAEVTRSDTLPPRGVREFPRLPINFSTEPSGPPDLSEISVTTLARPSLVARRASSRNQMQQQQQHVTLSVPVAEESGEEREGPLAGVHPIERTHSHLPEAGGDEEEEDAGPMHFASSKTRLGAKSLKEISNLFKEEGDNDDNDDEGGPSGIGGA